MPDSWPGAAFWDALGWSPTQSQRQQLVELQQELRRWNERVNLTRLVEGDDYWINQVFDSLWPLQKELQTAEQERRAIDVGTGGGFPGLAVAIALPGTHMTLLDSVGRKTTAVAAMADSLGLAHRVTVITERIETSGHDRALRGGFDVVKFPLAIACMVALLAMFVFANKKSVELRKLELEIGQQHIDPKRPKAAIFHGLLNPIFSSKWFEDKRYFALKGRDGRTSYAFKDLLADVSAAPVHERVGIIRRKLRDVAKQKQKESGIYEDVSIESGLSVLVRWAEMLKKSKEMK